MTHEEMAAELAKAGWSVTRPFVKPVPSKNKTMLVGKPISGGREAHYFNVGYGDPVIAFPGTLWLDQQPSHNGQVVLSRVWRIEDGKEPVLLIERMAHQ